MQLNIEEQPSLTLAQTYANQLAMIIKGSNNHQQQANYQTICRQFISKLSENLSSVEEFDEFRAEFNRLCEQDTKLKATSSEMGKGLEAINKSLERCREVIEEKNSSSCVLF